ncbi:putative F-box protein At3g28280 [Papaver somniferum]|uniref:putative F-box protein At3g28280 n=1 Tax=Papaver somniferum TaxID=3469 RepID=UPI000E705292|nr:putative F-box protein At3g28280 [Papaver somniferum]
MSMSEESSSSRRLMKTLNNNTYFSEDLWLQIFPYFRLNVIFKFKCVSRVWNFHLSSPNLIYKWIQFNADNTTLPWILVYIFKQKHLRKFSIAYLESHSPYISNHNGFSFEFLNGNPNSSSYSTLYFLGSSNGLVLCLRNTFHYVCNPLTHKWVQLPPTPHQDDSERLSTLTGFVCDCFTFPTTSYKVVRIPPWHRDSNKFSIQVFSSDLGKWNLYEVYCPEGVNLRFPKGASDLIIHNNVLYWIHHSSIVAYNLENNESELRQCRLIDLPDRGNGSTRCLRESNGSIFYARIKMREKTLCVWVLQEENFHLFHSSIDLHDLFADMVIQIRADLNGSRWRRDIVKVFGFDPVDSNVVMIGYKHYIWAYNTGTRKYDELCHPFFLGNPHSAFDVVYLPLVLKVMPTVLPPRSW